MIRCEWIQATDGHGEYPFGFRCERCGEMHKITMPLSINEFKERGEAFIELHKNCKEKKA
jgi:hypothetical protein